MKTYDIVSGLILAIGSILMIWLVIPEQSSSGVGFAVSPSVLPTITLSIVLILSLILVGSRVFGFVVDRARPMELQHWNSLMVFAAILGSGYLGFLFFGYIAGGMLLVFLFLIYIGEKKPVVIICTTVAAPLVIYSFFWKLLTISLP